MFSAAGLSMLNMLWLWFRFWFRVGFVLVSWVHVGRWWSQFGFVLVSCCCRVGFVGVFWFRIGFVLVSRLCFGFRVGFVLVSFWFRGSGNLVSIWFPFGFPGVSASQSLVFLGVFVFSIVSRNNFGNLYAFR
jgi:hypothetical protein